MFLHEVLPYFYTGSLIRRESWLNKKYYVSNKDPRSCGECDNAVSVDDMMALDWLFIDKKTSEKVYIVIQNFFANIVGVYKSKEFAENLASELNKSISSPDYTHTVIGQDVNETLP